MNKDRQVLSIGVLGCGPIAQFAHFESCIKARNMRLYALCDQAPDLAVRMDYHEGFHIYGEHGSVVLHGVPRMGADVEDGTLAMRAMAAIARSVTSGDWVRLETVTGGV